MRPLIMKIILWFLGFFGYGKEKAAVEAYQAEGEKESLEAIDRKAQEIEKIETGVQAREEKDHEKIVSAADPGDAALDLLRSDGIITPDPKTNPGADS